MAKIISNNKSHEIFPYNYLIDLLFLNTYCISFLLIIFNIFIVDYIKNKNLLNYLPDFIKATKLYTIIEFLFNRFLKIWSISKKPILIISYFFIIIHIIIIQICLIIILYY
jgi:hypothetical protein